MSKIKMYRVQINSDALEVGAPILWVHKGQQWISTANRPQVGLLFEDQIKVIRSNGFDVEILEEFEFEEVRPS